MANRLISSFSSKFIALFALALIASGCTSNTPFRDKGLTDCSANDCDEAFIEHHAEYDLAFVEFSERGNVFDRENMNAVIEHVASFSGRQAENPQAGVLAVVYVHGWKHNAAPTNGNVASFRRLLEKTAVLTNDGHRRLVGIYVGWRGLSLDVPVVKNLSYWDRKEVAHQVGKGGVTELLLRLEKTVIDDADPNRNLFMITAHSFGSVITLSALNEILLERVVDAEAEIEPGTGQVCHVTRPFSHGVALINPAIEANEILQLKEAVAETNFCSKQDRLMHIISSDADQANNIAFRVGQWFGVNVGWRQTNLDREIDGSALQFEESALDTITVGNYAPFRTGRLKQRESGNGSSIDWDYGNCVGGKKDCLDQHERDNHIDVDPNEPLAFIYTDSSFIPDHNDVFTDSVAGYLGAIMSEARAKRLEGSKTPLDDHLPEGCESGEFEFGDCFDNYLKAFELISLANSPG